MAFDLHVFANRDGKVCASMTDGNGVRSKPLQLTVRAAMLLSEIAFSIAENGESADSKVAEDVEP
jgi:hypothetical protein